MAKFITLIKRFLKKGSILEKKWIDRILSTEQKIRLRKMILETNSPEEENLM